jgi:transposase
MKYDYDVKLKAVLSVINDHRSARSVAKEIGSEQKHIRRWVAMYKAHGIKGLLHKANSYTGDFKVSVIRYMHENHLSLFETAIKFGIANDSVV